MYGSINVLIQLWGLLKWWQLNLHWAVVCQFILLTVFNKLMLLQPDKWFLRHPFSFSCLSFTHVSSGTDLFFSVTADRAFPLPLQPIWLCNIILQKLLCSTRRKENSWGKVIMSHALLHRCYKLVCSALSIRGNEGKERKAKLIIQNICK